MEHEINLETTIGPVRLVPNGSICVDSPGGCAWSPELHGESDNSGYEYLLWAGMDGPGVVVLIDSTSSKAINFMRVENAAGAQSAVVSLMTAVYPAGNGADKFLLNIHKKIVFLPDPPAHTIIGYYMRSLARISSEAVKRSSVLSKIYNPKVINDHLFWMWIDGATHYNHDKKSACGITVISIDSDNRAKVAKFVVGILNNKKISYKVLATRSLYIVIPHNRNVKSNIREALRAASSSWVASYIKFTNPTYTLVPSWPSNGSIVRELAEATNEGPKSK